MVKLIMGLKGSGKTKKLVDLVISAVNEGSGDVVVIGDGPQYVVVAQRVGVVFCFHALVVEIVVCVHPVEIEVVAMLFVILTHHIGAAEINARKGCEVLVDTKTSHTVPTDGLRKEPCLNRSSHRVQLQENPSGMPSVTEIQLEKRDFTL